MNHSPWTRYDAILTVNSDEPDVITLIVNEKARTAINDPDQIIPWRTVHDLLQDYVVPLRSYRSEGFEAQFEPFAIQDAPPGWMTAARTINVDVGWKGELGQLCGSFWRKGCRVGFVLNNGPALPLNPPEKIRSQFPLS